LETQTRTFILTARLFLELEREKIGVIHPRQQAHRLRDGRDLISWWKSS
jgi:hypothetical protein